MREITKKQKKALTYEENKKNVGKINLCFMRKIRKNVEKQTFTK